MYAIIRTGGKQAKVRKGDVIDVERLKVENEEVSFTPLFVVADDGSTISGREQLSKVKVNAKVLGETLGPKIDILKYKPKTGSRTRAGHRQHYTRLQITGIVIPRPKVARKAAAAKEQAEPAAEPETSEES